MLKKFIAHCLVFSLVFNNLAFATQSIIELDFKDSETPQRLHVIPRLSNVGDVSHLEIDTERKQVVVHKLNKANEGLSEQSVADEVSPVTSPIIIPKHDVQNLPWELESEKLTLFILNHNAWLSPLNENGYKLEFRGELLGGGGVQSTGGGGGGSSNSGGGGQCRPSVWSECDNRGNCELNITVCNTHNNYSSNDHSISGSSGKGGGNDRTGGYGNSSSSGHGSSGGFVGGYVAPDLSRHPQSTDPTEIAFWRHNIILNYPRDNVMHYLKKNAFIAKDDIKDKLLDDALLQIVLNYNRDMSSPMKIVLETLSYITRQDLRNMLNGLEHTRDYTVPLSKSDALKRLIIMSNMFIDRVSPDFWGVGPGSDCFHWGQLSKINAKSAITKVLVSQLFNKGIDLLKTSGQPVYKGSKYLLTQNRNGEISVACPYNRLVYPLFAEDRPVGESYLHRTYVYDPLLDQALWKTVHGYVNGTLSKSPYPTTWKEYIYHTEPAFYVVRTALREAVEQAGKSNVYISVNTRSSLEQQLQKAIAHHILLTPLFKQDSSLNITKTLAPLLFNKGVDLLQASQTRVLKNPNYPYTLTLNTNGDLSSFCPWNGLLYPLFPDDRTNYKAFLPATYVRDGYDTYLEQFFYKLAGDHFSGQEKSNMLHVLAPLPHVSRTAFKDIPMKKENFPSLRESSTLLLEMAGDVMYGMPLKDFLAKAQQFFDKEIPFKKINNDVLVHQHLTQNMLAKELREDRWALGDQYWKTTSPVAQWGVIANVLEAVARKYNIVGASLIDTAKTRQMLDDLGFELPTFSQEELRTKILPCEKLDGFGRQLCEWVDFNFEPLFNGAIFLMNRGVKVPVNAKLQLKPKLQANAPPVLQRQPDFKWNVKEANVADKVVKHDYFGKFYKDPIQKVGNKDIWWSKDIAGKHAHSGEHYKLFERTKEGMHWIADVDITGKVIPKHKSNIGRFIPNKELIGVK